MAPKKEVTAYIKLQVPAGAANPSPPIGPALGQQGVNIMEFCKSFNDKTKDMEKGMPIPVVISVYKDRSFTFIMRKPPVSYYIKRAAKLQSASKTPGRNIVAQLSQKQVREIAQEKMIDMNSNDVEAAMKMVAGSARSMGITVLEG